MLVGIDHIAMALGHPLAVWSQHLALVEQPLERLAEVDHAHITQRAHEEAAVQQVHDRVFGATHVLVDRQPVARLVGFEGPLREIGRDVAQEVPGRVHEGVHGVGLAPRRAATDRAGGVDEAGAARQWVAFRLGRDVELDVLWQQHR